MADAEILVKIVDKTRGGMSSVKKNLDDVDRSAKNANGSFLTLNRAVGAFAAALSVQAIANFGTSVQNLQNRLKLLPDSFGSVADNLDRVRDIANATQQPIDATADLFQKIARSADQYGLSAQNVGTVTETFANLLRLAGADAAAADGAIRQLGQALGSGALRGDEFNSIVEATAGEILPLLARELGVTQGQVRELASEGKITGDVLINALGTAADEVGARTGNMAVTIGGALTTLQNNFLVLGSKASPVFDTIASGILLVAENLETAITFAGAFVASFAAAKLAAAVSALGGLRAAILAVNTAIMANPIGLIATGIAVAITGIITYWDELKFAVENTFTYMQIAYQKFVIGFTEGIENAINSVYNAFVSLGDNTRAIFAGIGAALADPLNATEAFATAMEESLSASAERTTEKLVDFSGSLVDNKARLSELEQQLASAKAEFNETSDSTQDNTTAVNENANSWERVSSGVETTNKELERAQENYNNFLSNLKRSVELAQYDSKERQRQQAIYKALELRTKALAAEQKTLGEAERAEITATINALFDKQEAYEAELELIEERKDFIKDTEEEIRDITRETMNEVQRLEQEKNDFISEARRLGVAEHESTQDRILAYDEQIKSAQIDLEEDLRKKRQQAIDDTVSEYSSLYGFMGDKLQELTGVSSKEFGLIRDVVKITFGTDIQEILKTTFANGVFAVGNFGDESKNIVGDLATGIGTEMKTSEGSIFDFASNGLTTMTGFVKGVLNNFSTLGGGIINVLGTAFEYLTGGFSSVFGSLSGLIDGFFGFVGGMIGGITEIPFMAKGGFIPQGGAAIVGEAGPEIVRGPATVTSAEETADILTGGVPGGNVNVSFNISTVDARGFDELLTSRRDVITDLIRTAVIESPSRQLRGVY